MERTDSPHHPPPPSSLPPDLAALAAQGRLSAPSRPGHWARLGPYDIVGSVGRGGMGIVLLATDRDSGRKIALKILRTDLTEAPRARRHFLKEANHLRRLDHPNVIPILAVGDDPKACWIAMPLMSGGSLADRLRTGSSLSREEVLSITTQVAEALAHTHERGIIHQDLKPGNILFDERGGAIITDFGLARSVSNDSLFGPASDHQVGTAPYMSPDVAAGKAEDTRCDIYSLGAVMYEMLTGRAPYEGKQAREIIRQILERDPTPIRERNPGADLGLSRIAERAMARRQQDRYANMAEMLADLERVRKGEVPVGAPTSGRTTARKPWGLGVAAVALLGCGAMWLLKPDMRFETTHLIQPPQVSCWADAVIADWDGAPGKELLVTEDEDLLPVTLDGTVLPQWHCAGAQEFGLHVELAADVNGDSLDEAFVTWAEGDNLHLAIVNQVPRRLAGFTTKGQFPTTDDRSEGSFLHPKLWLPSDPSVEKSPAGDLLGLIHTNYRREPRGIWSFDAHAEQLQWQTLTGPRCRNIVPHDLDGDGEMEFLVSTASPGNGNVGPDGTTDFESGVFAFSNDGRQLWWRPLGGESTHTEVLSHDLDGDGSPEILARTAGGEALHREQQTSQSRVVLLDEKGQVTREYQPGNCLKSFVVTDWNRGGTPEVICADCRGNLHVLGADLRPLRIVQQLAGTLPRANSYDEIWLSLVAVSQFVEGSEVQLLINLVVERQDDFQNGGQASQPLDHRIMERSELLLLDAHLAVLARHTLHIGLHGQWPYQVTASDIDADGISEIVVFSDRATVFEVRDGW